jgi:hypothetical protein
MVNVRGLLVSIKCYKAWIEWSDRTGFGIKAFRLLKHPVGPDRSIGTYYAGVRSVVLWTGA